MAKRNPTISVRRGLRKLGDDLKKARIRRRLTMALVAERAGISRETLSKIQKGDPTVAVGSYAMVIMALGMGTEWLDVADIRNDTWGQIIADEDLPKRVRARKTA
ncbi:MAG TPA: helix-turn-helix domain-containing protein [Desulfobacteraceae bacterium]|jgi:transcriptional regulator with XRE-family HTH domain|nr:helix-turn-helix domain-containing protein [Desulfobacteraceae bacterium]